MMQSHTKGSKPMTVSKKVRLNPAHYYPGARGAQVTWLGERLVAHGFGKHYTKPGTPGKSGPGPTFHQADRENVADFQRAQGWKGADADGLPGKDTLRLLDKAVKTAKAKPAPKKPDPIAKIVSIAKSQVGYHEGRSNGHWNNLQKYAQQVPGLGWDNGYAWCATFVSWCALKAGLADYYPRTATVSVAESWFKQRGQWSEYPAIGAQVCYGNGAHTGLVYDYDGTYIYTIEGNTNTNGSAEGDGVYAKKRVRRDAYVTGYGYPKIPGVKLKSADPKYKG